MEPPSTRTLLSSLISQLSTLAPSVTDTKLQQLLLSIHCLLPSTFLPALDLLDRRLVTRCIRVHADVGVQASSADTSPQPQHAVYYVRSTAPPPPAAKGNKYASSSTSRYEVRTQVWNCTCASFTFAAYNNSTDDGDLEGGPSIWGGCSLGGTPPACKHLVACVLAENCRGLFQDRVVEEMVDENMMAELAVLED
ncbi:hypothetical protein K440DRAFT_633141 [Wilcoxina mikolae CBS 423.85]|nr:hypothetical protein K440DRAFT_633141 [Wilcoxina mikolae CBS 423.85]